MACVGFRGLWSHCPVRGRAALTSTQSSPCAEARRTVSMHVVGSAARAHQAPAGERPHVDHTTSHHRQWVVASGLADCNSQTHPDDIIRRRETLAPGDQRPTPLAKARLRRDLTCAVRRFGNRRPAKDSTGRDSPTAPATRGIRGHQETAPVTRQVCSDRCWSYSADADDDHPRASASSGR